MAFLLRPPRRLIQPSGPVEIDWTHPIARGLVFFVVPSQKGAQELVGGAAQNILGASTISAGKDGAGLNSGSTTTGGAGYAYRQDMFRTISTDFTIAASLDIKTLMANSKIVCAPLLGSSWNQPYQALSISRNGTNSQVAVYIGTEAGQPSQNATFPVGTMPASPGQRYIISRSGTSAWMVYNGGRYTPSSTTLTANAVAFNTGGHVALLNRSQGTVGEGTDGVMQYAAIWNRALSFEEQSGFQDNPYQILKPSGARFYTVFAVDSGSAVVASPFTSEFSHEFEGQPAAQTAAQSIAAALVSSKPTITATATATRLVTSVLASPKSAIVATATQAFPARAISGTIPAKKPILAATVSQSIDARFLTATILAKKPAASGSATQTFPARTLSATLVASKPTISATAAAAGLSARTVTATIAAPRPTVRGIASTVTISPHLRAPPWRTVDAGTGSAQTSWAAPLDPNALLDFTVDWNDEMSAGDTIQTAFLALSGQAAAAGMKIHSESHDADSVTAWLKIDPFFQTSPAWNGAGEIHEISCRVSTTVGRIHDRTFTLTVRTT